MSVKFAPASAIATLVAWYVRRAKLREHRDWLAHEDRVELDLRRLRCRRRRPRVCVVP
jgi:hypothetical protein